MNRLKSLLMVFAGSIVTVSAATKFEIESVSDFLKGFTVGITGTASVFIFIYLIKMIKEKKTTKLELYLPVGLFSLFFGLFLIQLDREYIWLAMIGAVFVGFGTVLNIKYLSDKKRQTN